MKGSKGKARSVSRAAVRGFGILTAAAVLIGWGVWTAALKPATSAESRGEEVARKLGCFGCHGPAGAGGVGDPTSPSGTIPGWGSGTAVMYIKSANDIREWILFGVPRERAAEEKALNQGTLVPMPAYEGLLSAQELDDLVAYFLAVSGWSPEIPDSVYEGRKIAARFGCFGCHGPSGMGGVKNPGSLKGYIPPWQGEEFADLVRDEQELREWILAGRAQRLWDNPAARHFLETQTIQMPAYQTQLPEHDLDKIVAFIDWLRGRPR